MKCEKCIMPDNPPFWRNWEAVKWNRERYHKHHVMMGKNRRLADEDGLVIFLTPSQHQRIHRDRDYCLYAMMEAQRAYEAVEGTRSDFIARYGKNYL